MKYTSFFFLLLLSITNNTNTFLSTLSRQALFGNFIQGALLLKMLFTTKDLSNSTSSIDDSLLVKPYPLDDKSKEIVTKVLKIDPNIISVLPIPANENNNGLMIVKTLQYQDHSLNGKIYLKDKTVALLNSDNEKELYQGLAVIAHEYNHCLNGDTDFKALMKKAGITQIFVFGSLFGLEFLFSKFQSMRGIIAIVKNNGYIKEGFNGFCAAFYKILIADAVFSNTRRGIEFRADHIQHDNPVELYKLLSGLELYLTNSDQSSSKSLDHIEEQGYAPKFVVSIFKFLSKISIFFSNHPSTRARLSKIHGRKAEILQQYQTVAEYVKKQ